MHRGWRILQREEERERERNGGSTGATRPLISTYRYRSTKLPSSASLRGCSLVKPMSRSRALKLAENERVQRYQTLPTARSKLELRKWSVA